MVLLLLDGAASQAARWRHFAGWKAAKPPWRTSEPFPTLRLVGPMAWTVMAPSSVRWAL